MGRHKYFDDFELPKSVVEIVRANCADYNRRAYELRKSELRGETRETYINLNAIVDKALDSVEDAMRNDILNDIIGRKGYFSSEAQGMICRDWYYRRKRKAMCDIARGMNLI